MNHKQRIQACLNGDQPDRTPVALWRHFPVDDMTSQGLADAHLFFQKTYDFDLLKVTSTSAYFLYDWGFEDQWQGNTEGTRLATKLVIHSPDDWEKLTVLDPYQGFLATQLDAVKKITTALGPITPVIPTIFNPLSIAKKLVGADNLLTHLRENPDKLHKGLAIITESTRKFVEAVIKETGAAGIFFAIQHAQESMLSKEEYRDFGCEYDRPILVDASPLWLNMLHLHGKDIYFNDLADSLVDVINWHDLDTPPNLAEGKKKFPGVVCGGLRQTQTLALGNPEEVRAEAKAAIEATEGTRFILGTGCVTPIITPHGNLRAVRDVVEE